MFKKYQNKLYCFSPPVMLATFLIEFGIAFYALWRYKMNKVGRLIVITLFALGIFQLSEYLLCGGLGLTNVEWARVGYIAITLLPALGLHIIVTTADKKMPVLIGAAYTCCAIFCGFYLFHDSSVTLQTCLPNYAVFSAYKAISVPFSIYYFTWIVIGICLSLYWSKKMPKQRKILQSMVIGYLVFLVPTATANILNPSTISGIPSIMCGFAVLLVFIILAEVLPGSCETRKPISK
jgi:hypothetical protein